MSIKGKSHGMNVVAASIAPLAPVPRTSVAVWFTVTPDKPDGK